MKRPYPVCNILLGRAVPLYLTGSLLALTCSAQQPAAPQAVPTWVSASGGPKLEFEAASVRLSSRQLPTRGKDLLLPLDDASPKSGLFSANLPLMGYIVYAYKIIDLSQYQTLSQHLPEWANTDQYDIEARAAGTPTKDQMRIMMQSLLRERFKLAAHFELKQTTIYALLLDAPGKLGPQLKAHPDDVPCNEKPGQVGQPTGAGDHPRYCGVDAWDVDGRLHMRMINVTCRRQQDSLAAWRESSAVATVTRS